MMDNSGTNLVKKIMTVKAKPAVFAAGLGELLVNLAIWITEVETRLAQIEEIDNGKA